MSKALLTHKAMVNSIAKKAGELNALRSREGTFSLGNTGTVSSSPPAGATPGPRVRPDVAEALRAVRAHCEETGKAESEMTVGDVFKAIESLRTRRLQVATNKTVRGDVDLSTAPLERLLKLTNLGSNKRGDDWLKKAVATKEVQNTFTVKDAEALSSKQWKDKTRNVTVREYTTACWKSDVDHSVNAMYANNDCVFAGLGSGRIVILSKDGELRMTMTGHSGYVSALTGCGQVLFSGSLDGTVRLWVYHEGEQMAMSAGHAGPVHSLHYCARTKVLYSGSSDQTVRAWNLTEGKSLVLCKFEEPECSVFSLTEGVNNVLVAGLECGKVAFIDMESGTVTRTLEGHTDIVASVDVHKDSRTCISGSRDHTCRVWFAGRTNVEYAKHKGPVYRVKFVNGGKMCISAGGDQSVHRWNVVDGTCTSIFLGHQATVFAFDFCQGRMFTADRSCRMYMWEGVERCEFCEPVKCGVGCKWRFCRCSNEGCELRLPEADVHEHFSVCPKRIMPCRNKDCKERLCYDKITEHMLHSCDHSFVDCPNGSFCTARVKRKQLAAHLAACRPPDPSPKKAGDVVVVEDGVVPVAANEETVAVQKKPLATQPSLRKKSSAPKKKASSLPRLTPKRRAHVPKVVKKKPASNVRVWRPGK